MTERPESDRGPISLLIFIESAKAVMNMREICQKAEDLSTMAPIVPVALVLGADDLLASLRKKQIYLIPMKLIFFLNFVLEFLF